MSSAQGEASSGEFSELVQYELKRKHKLCFACGSSTIKRSSHTPFFIEKELEANAPFYPTLILAPAGLLDAWITEIRNHFGSMLRLKLFHWPVGSYKRCEKERAIGYQGLGGLQQESCIDMLQYFYHRSSPKIYSLAIDQQAFWTGDVNAARKFIAEWRQRAYDTAKLAIRDFFLEERAVFGDVNGELGEPSSQRLTTGHSFSS
ncbi:hypothetical protein P175DRAFT_0533926 [Aspergillus ochraceoroseus IBT 24754]|uniref:SNF2 N-terminal domain-containing protein n=1 Tax=Aspergillus ochraceoroseus IBT 24754 TaxID=1392256 RepID=A0A2T5LT78_9EURO|nr:uncharacterized protein P175DRAFT_0533926 [Aspergillus ochraceoroseus IBT 24754]PTU19493.1 hypothetical protein P175DRAFT_0533926 [Aspergillus ochraceoroseus IBT 24754]